MIKMVGIPSVIVIYACEHAEVGVGPHLALKIMLCLNDFLSLGPGRIRIFRVPNLQFLVDLIDISKANLIIVSSEDRHTATVTEVKFD